MCGIAGFSSFHVNYKEESARWFSILQKMNTRQHHRGPDENGVYLSRNCGLSHTRLSILDLEYGKQPMARQHGNHRAVICYNGEIYNMPGLRRKLEAEGVVFETTCDTEVILMGYLLHGTSYITKLNGIFSFAIYDETLRRLYLFRDRLGVKPLFYTLFRNTLIFSSELKGILCYQIGRAHV